MPQGIRRACDGSIQLNRNLAEVCVLMASAIGRAAIHSAVQKTPSQSQRTLKLKEKAEEILTKVSVEEEAMDKFSVDMLTYLRVEVRSVADKYKGSSKKREHLWSMFHKVRMETKLPSLWINLMGKIGHHC